MKEDYIMVSVLNFANLAMYDKLKVNLLFLASV